MKVLTALITTCQKCSCGTSRARAGAQKPPGCSCTLFSQLLFWIGVFPSLFYGLGILPISLLVKRCSSFTSFYRKIIGFWKVIKSQKLQDPGFEKLAFSSFTLFMLIILLHLWKLYQSHHPTLFRHPVPVNQQLFWVYLQKSCGGSVPGFFPDKCLKSKFPTFTSSLQWKPLSYNWSYLYVKHS